MAEVDYQKAGLVRQALNERELAEAYGDDARAATASKRLANLGYVEEKAKPAKVAKDEPPQGRTAKKAAQQTTAAEMVGDED